MCILQLEFPHFIAKILLCNKYKLVPRHKISLSTIWLKILSYLLHELWYSDQKVVVPYSCYNKSTALNIDNNPFLSILLIQNWISTAEMQLLLFIMTKFFTNTKFNFLLLHRDFEAVSCMFICMVFIMFLRIQIVAFNQAS